jgi:hypothetical protein
MKDRQYNDQKKKDRQYNGQKKKDRQDNGQKKDRPNDKVITIKDVGILISVMYK